MPTTTLTKCFCELCETEFMPKTPQQVDIVCPSCNVGEVRKAREVGPWLREDNTRRHTALLPTKRPHRATDADYHALVLIQGGRCAICETQPQAGSLVIDHNHRNGQVRGLLCQECNKGLGSMGDHPEILKRAVAYLEQRGCYGSFPRPPEAVRNRR